MSDFAYLSISDLGDRLRGGAVTVEAILETANSRIARFNSRYRAFSYLSGSGIAIAEGLDAELREGTSRGPLHGMLVSVKGNIPVADLPWTEGSRLFANRRAPSDAAVVAKARAAGTIVLGTTTLSELAMYGATNDFEPLGLNPWDVRRTAGGSSTGAGVSSVLGMAHVNIGTDAGGSIRNPACHCGVVGLMPGIDDLTGSGVANYSPSLSSVGLIGRSVDDVAIAYRTLANPLPPKSTAPSFRLLVPWRIVEENCDVETRLLFRQAIELLSRAECKLLDHDLPQWLPGEAAAGTIFLHECGRALAQMDLSQASEGIRNRAKVAARLTAEHITEARRRAAELKAAVDQALREADADAVVSPTWPFAAPLIDAETARVGNRTVAIDAARGFFVRAANAINGCAITLPMGIYPSVGVPAGLHLMAQGGNEARLLATARLAERILPKLPRLPDAA